MKTQRPDEDVSNAIDYPFYILWELDYKDGNMARGVCLVATAEASLGVQRILSHEAQTAELRPIRLVSFGGLRFCPDDGQQGDYKFCTTCGRETEIRDLNALVGELTAQRYCPICPESNERGEDDFCYECSHRTWLRDIVSKG